MKPSNFWGMLLQLATICVIIVIVASQHREHFATCKSIVPPGGVNCTATQPWACVNGTPMRVNSAGGMEMATLDGINAINLSTDACTAWTTVHNGTSFAITSDINALIKPKPCDSCNPGELCTNALTYFSQLCRPS